jgi:josephin
VNALLQKKAFAKPDFDRIASNLCGGAFFNPHKSLLGTGNYDVNVLMTALQQVNFREPRGKSS